MSAKVQLIKPCPENWSAMQNTQTGKYCLQCHKNVVDFSQKSNDEITTYLHQHSNGVCGRFHVNQVALTSPYQSKLSWFRKKWMACLAAVSLIGFNKKAWSINHSNTSRVNPVNYKGAVKKEKTIVHGWIKSIDGKKGLSQIEIRISSGGKTIAYSTSFSNGSYFIDIPENTIIDFTMNIEFSHANIVTQLITDVPAQKNRISCDAFLNPIATLSLHQNYALKDTMYEYHTEHMVLGGVGSSVHYSTPIEPMIKHINEVNVESRTIQYEQPVDSIKTETIDEIIDPFTIKAYPNPTTDLFTVEIKNSVNSQIFIYDMEGKLIEGRVTNNTYEQISLVNQPNGVYIVNVVNMDKNQAKQTKVIRVN